MRHHHLAREDKERLQGHRLGRLGVGISGLAGLYAHFLLLGDAWLADGGLAIWLIPSEFMDVNYGAALKTYLTERVTLRHIHRYGPSDAQFTDAMVTSAIVVFEKTPPPRDMRSACRSEARSPSRPASESVPLATLRSARKWTAFPGTVTAGLAYHDARRLLHDQAGPGDRGQRVLHPGAGGGQEAEASRKCSSSRSCRVRDISRRM